MAIFTPVSMNEVEGFLTQYNIGEAKKLTPITSGIENTNYKLTTSLGEYILTLFEARTPKSALPFVFSLLQHLHENNLPVAMPCHNKNGEIISNLNEKPAAIVQFLAGSSVLTTKNKHCYKVGESLAKLHVASTKFNESRKNPFGLDSFASFKENIKGNIDEIECGLSELIKNEISHLNATLKNSLPKLPQGIIHADLFTDNILFLDSKNDPQISGIIDFYYASSGSFAYDLAITINCWAGRDDGELDPELSKAVLNGYQNIRPLEKAEIDAMNDLFRMAALRFLLSRANDWFMPIEKLEVAKKDPLEYVNKLRFHKKQQSYEKFGL